MGLAVTCLAQAQVNTVVAPDANAGLIRVFNGETKSQVRTFGSGSFVDPVAAMTLGQSGKAFVVDAGDLRISHIDYRSGSVLSSKLLPYRPQSIAPMKDGTLLIYADFPERVGFSYDYEEGAVKRVYLFDSSTPNVNGLVQSGEQVVGVTTSGARIISWPQAGGAATVSSHSLRTSTAFTSIPSKHDGYIYVAIRDGDLLNFLLGPSTIYRMNESSGEWDPNFSASSTFWRLCTNFQMGENGYAFGAVREQNLLTGLFDCRVGRFNLQTGDLFDTFGPLATYNGIAVETNEPDPVPIAISRDKGAAYSGGTVFVKVDVPMPAPQGGWVIPLWDNSGVTATPASVFIPEGSMSATVPITSTNVSQDHDVTVSADFHRTTVSTNFKILRANLNSIQFGRDSILGGQSVGATLRLNGRATEVREISLTSSHPDIVKAPAVAHIMMQNYINTIVIPTGGVANPTNVTVTAQLDSITKSDSILVLPANLVSIKGPAQVAGGYASWIDLGLDALTPAAGFRKATLTSSDPTAISVPAFVNFPVNSNKTRFQAQSYPVTSDRVITLSATMNGVTKTHQLQVLMPRIKTVKMSSGAVQGGSSITLIIELTGPATSNGSVVNLSTNKPNLITLPANATVPSGVSQYQVTVPTKPVANTTTVDITGTLGVSKGVRFTIAK